MLSKIGIAIMALALVDLLYLNYWIFKNDKGDLKVAERVVTTIPTPLPPSASGPSSGLSAGPSAEPSASPVVETKTVEKTVVEKQTETIVQTAQKEIFIPIGSGSTKSNSYTALPGLEVTIDTSKYSTIESVVFEGSVWVQDGNGKAYVVLYAKDIGEVIGSEMTTTSATAVLKTSGKFSLPGGSKTYQVRAKTDLTEFAAHIDNARVKITLK